MVKRWPIILTGIIDTIYRIDHELSVSLPAAGGTDKAEVPQAEEKLAEGKLIIEKISKLKYDMARDRLLECVIQSTDIHYKHTDLKREEKYRMTGRRMWPNTMQS